MLNVVRRTAVLSMTVAMAACPSGGDGTTIDAGPGDDGAVADAPTAAWRTG